MDDSRCIVDLVFEEYTHSGSNNRWTSTDAGDVVTRVIPEEI